MQIEIHNTMGGEIRIRNPMLVIRERIAARLLEMKPFTPTDSTVVLKQLENDPVAVSALREIGGKEKGAVRAVEMVLRSMERVKCVQLEEVLAKAVKEKSKVIVQEIDDDRLTKELFPGNNQHSTSGMPPSLPPTSIPPSVLPPIMPMQNISYGPNGPHPSGLPPLPPPLFGLRPLPPPPKRLPPPPPYFCVPRPSMLPRLPVNDIMRPPRGTGEYC